MLQLKRFRVGACALAAGLLASTGALALPFHILVDGEADFGNETHGADSSSFVDHVVATQIGGTLRTPSAASAYAYDGVLFDSGFDFPAASPGVRPPVATGSFVGGVIAVPVLPRVSQALTAASGATPTANPASGGAGSFAEPASVALLGLGLAALAYSSMRWRRKRKRRRPGH